MKLMTLRRVLVPVATFEKQWQQLMVEEGEMGSQEEKWQALPTIVYFKQ